MGNCYLGNCIEYNQNPHNSFQGLLLHVSHCCLSSQRHNMATNYRSSVQLFKYHLLSAIKPSNSSSLTEQRKRLEESSSHGHCTLLCSDSTLVSVTSVLDSGQHQLILGGVINLHSGDSCAIAHLWSIGLASFLTQCGTHCVLWGRRIRNM